MSLRSFSPASAFREQLEKDLEEVFFNAREFAETHTWDGKPIVATLNTSSAVKEGAADHPGVYAWECTLHARVRDIGPKPRPGSLHELDGQDYIVGPVSDLNGEYIITLGATLS